ncbi:hypothetical protein M128_3053 [Bacteroides fragilis str. S6L8]|nr:hypothetical protein M139_2923 [Bacteroides fragilis str. S23L24]EYA84630.1 hypothetical protein M137_3616 [Bacteroides fragilis str. S36L12]EYA90289.1 hypothetical protein M135_3248 [Bacteroides fragilis str. S36L5]EYA99453.1 hypothetical protein M128_3053 [Bacteroides fragilis str. S6L8]EYB04445.1 hypothetical protein M129_3020 [Bacteroides fragilis str. S6R5]EYE46866.1 hypothetical protein M127_2961 [Bacteroides fragilis str. S6L5]
MITQQNKIAYAYAVNFDSHICLTSYFLSRNRKSPGFGMWL